MYLAYLLGLELIQRDPVAVTRPPRGRGRERSSDTPTTPLLWGEENSFSVGQSTCPLGSGADGIICTYIRCVCRCVRL